VRLTSWKLGLLVCAGIGIAAGAAMAQSGEVYSLNIVGFQKVTRASGGMTMVSTPFWKATPPVQEVVGTQLVGGKNSGVADNILVWNKTNQTYATYWLNNSGVWSDMSGLPATNAMLTPDMGFWVRNRRTSNQTVVVSGDVTDDAVVTNVLFSGMNLVSYPFSTDIDINLSGLTNGKSGKNSAGADNISIWNAVTQSYGTYWLNNSRQWCDLGGTPVSGVKVGSGVGFWYRNRNTNTAFITWVEVRPYTL